MLLWHWIALSVASQAAHPRGPAAGASLRVFKPRDSSALMAGAAASSTGTGGSSGSSSSSLARHMSSQVPSIFGAASSSGPSLAPRAASLAPSSSGAVGSSSSGCIGASGAMQLRTEGIALSPLVSPATTLVVSRVVQLHCKLCTACTRGYFAAHTVPYLCAAYACTPCALQTAAALRTDHLSCVLVFHCLPMAQCASTRSSILSCVSHVPCVGWRSHRDATPVLRYSMTAGNRPWLQFNNWLP
jgi:hypothetical protein